MNSLTNSPSKSNREEKQEQPAVTTTTAATLSISSHNPESDLHVDETATTTESFWTDSGSQDELQHANIRNASDARGIFSNIVKTLNRGKS